MCIEKLDEIAAYLPGNVDFTLDNEPMNHPGLCELIGAAAKTRHINYFHHGMTTGVALISRPDKDKMIDAYLENGYSEFGITFHGAMKNHDEIVRRPGAYDEMLRAARYLLSRGCSINASLMMNRFFPEDKDAISAALSALPERAYGDFESVIYRGLDELRVRTVLL